MLPVVGDIGAGLNGWVERDTLEGGLTSHRAGGRRLL